MKTNGTGHEMTRDQVRRAHVAMVTVTPLTSCTDVKCGKHWSNSQMTNAYDHKRHTLNPDDLDSTLNQQHSSSLVCMSETGKSQRNTGINNWKEDVNKGSNAHDFNDASCRYLWINDSYSHVWQWDNRPLSTDLSKQSATCFAEEPKLSGTAVNTAAEYQYLTLFLYLKHDSKRKNSEKFGLLAHTHLHLVIWQMVRSKVTNKGGTNRTNSEVRIELFTVLKTLSG